MLVGRISDTVCGLPRFAPARRRDEISQQRMGLTSPESGPKMKFGFPYG